MSNILEKLAKSKNFINSIDEIRGYIAESDIYKRLTENLSDESKESIIEIYFSKSLEDLSKNNLIEIDNNAVKLTYNGKLKLIGGKEKTDKEYIVSLSPEEASVMKRLIGLSRIDSDLRQAFDIVLEKDIISSEELQRINLANRKVMAQDTENFIRELESHSFISKIDLSDERAVDKFIKGKYKSDSAETN